MSKATTQIIILIVLATLLIILYGATLIKVCMGSRYRLVIVLIILLICSNIGTLTNALLTAPTFEQSKQDPMPVSLTTNILLAVTYFVMEVCFAVAHWIFAARYR
jgi:hypothetical protein